MLIEESIWIKNQLKMYFNNDDFPMLNLGSSTKSLGKKINHIYMKECYPLLKKN